MGIHLKSSRSRTAALLGFAIVLTACSSQPVTKSIWVHPSKNAEERSLSWDRCNQKAGYAKTKFLNETPMQSQYTNAGGLQNLARSLESNNVRDRAFRICMRESGFRLEERCVRNCTPSA